MTASIRAARATRPALAGSAAITALTLAASASATAFIAPSSLLISSTTYANTSVVATIKKNVTKLAGGGTANSDGSFATVFNNASVDKSFGVTTQITIQDVSAYSGAVLNTLNIDPNVVSTSFPSKSELGLNLTQTSNGSVVTFVGYAGGGLGNLDVSNSDTTAYKDTTNPVTTAFGTASNNYAFNRSVVALNADGTYAATQTLAYGGNNGHSAVLGANGLYYTVGNSNNGTGTPSQLTTSTGLEVITPGGTPNSTEINASYQSIPGDKAGKDANFRGLTLFNGSLYFTKGSGGNGEDTVYTVSNPGGAVPTPATAGSAAISVLNGFPTDSAKLTGGNATPFGLFFANANTLYVADEGTGNTLDTSTNAGLEKWSLVNGVWKLDYVLRNQLIGSTYNVSGTISGQTGSSGPVTTIGLRNLAGRVNADGTVSLFATTATTSNSGDTGADPNEVVTISDLLSQTILPANEAFSVFDGPQYGTRYGGVALAPVPEPGAWALMLFGFGALGMGLRGRRIVARV